MPILIQIIYCAVLAEEKQKHYNKLIKESCNFQFWLISWANAFKKQNNPIFKTISRSRKKEWHDGCKKSDKASSATAMMWLCYGMTAVQKVTRPAVLLQWRGYAMVKVRLLQWCGYAMVKVRLLQWCGYAMAW
jgi:hypothetical protein